MTVGDDLRHHLGGVMLAPAAVEAQRKRKGDPALELYVIQSGRVEITTGNHLLVTVEKNDIFGEMALIDKDPRSATATAATDVTLVPVTEKQFLFLVAQTPFFALKVMRVLAGRLRVTNKAI